MLTPLIEQREIIDELKSWRGPLYAIAADVTEINNTTKLSQVTLEAMQIQLNVIQEQQSRIAPRKNFLIPV
jgi:hypothetical protein